MFGDKIINKTKILDCSLRDGGYYTNWDFEEKIIDTYIDAINHLPVDYLEIGYRSNPLPGYYGEFFYCPDYIMEELRQESNKKLAIMLNEKNVGEKDAQDLLATARGLVDMVRIAVNPVNLGRALKLAEAIKKMDFEVSFNVMYMSTWLEKKDFLSQIKYVDDIVDYFYMVDSYGGVYPNEIKECFELVRSRTSVKIGFHGHNNLEMGLINTLTAIERGADMVDATITGMGRGAGNLRTELLLTALNAKGVLDFDFDALSKAVDLFRSLQEEYCWGTNLPYIFSGANSLPQKEVMEWVGKRYYSFNSIVRTLANRAKGIMDNMELKDFSPKQKVERVLIIGGGPSGTIHAKAAKEFLKKNPEIVVIHVSSKNAKAYENISNKQIHCLAGNEGYRLESIFKNMTMKNRMAILPSYPRVMGTYIPKCFINNVYQLRSIFVTDLHKDSGTAIAIQTSLDLNVKEINFIGYDGYKDSCTINELELFNENEAIFIKLRELNIKFASLTPSMYTELPLSSIYAFL